MCVCQNPPSRSFLKELLLKEFCFVFFFGFSFIALFSVQILSVSFTCLLTLIVLAIGRKSEGL